MSLDLSKIKSRLSALSNAANSRGRSQLLWKPNPGKQIVRIVPYSFNLENPFIELKFHYNLNGKTYLSPDSFNRPDPIVEFSNRMKKTGDKEEWKLGKKLEPKLRTFAPILVRGEEGEGVRFWGFGKQVYEAILSVIADPDYGDITDLSNGRDITVEFKTAQELGKDYPDTSIIVKPNPTPVVDPTRKDLIEKLKNQVNILELFPELSYDELKNVMNAWLHPEDGDEHAVSTIAVADESEETPTPTPVSVTTSKSPSATSAKSNSDDVTAAFDNLFNT